MFSFFITECLFCVQKKETDRSVKHKTVRKADQKGLRFIFASQRVGENYVGRFFFSSSSSVLDLIHRACFNLSVAGALCM